MQVYSKIYISTIEANLKSFETKVKSESTVSEKMKDYINRKKTEISNLRKASEGKGTFSQSDLFGSI